MTICCTDVREIKLNYIFYEFHAKNKNKSELQFHSLRFHYQCNYAWFFNEFADTEYKMQYLNDDDCKNIQQLSTHAILHN